MSTTSKYANITQKKLLGYRDLNDRFLQYVQDVVHESLARVWDEPAIHDAALVMEDDGASQFKITGTSIAADGQGRLLRISDATVKSGIAFENSSGVDYYVALKYVDIPEEIDVNPRTGIPEYRNWIEEIGEKSTPDAVTDNGNGTITLQVDSVTEAGVTNAGRQVTVYKLIADKNATSFAVAVETCTVTWSGSQNEITTTGTLGQSTVSTVTGDYNVVMLGPTVKRYVDSRATNGYAYIGFITGGTPTYDHTDQELASVSLSQLAHIAAKASNDRLKIDVRPAANEEGIGQIITRDEEGVERFRVDERGQVELHNYPRILTQRRPFRNPSLCGLNVLSITNADMPDYTRIKTGAGCTIDGKRKVVFFDRDNNTAYKFDVETMLYEDKYDFTSDLNASYTWLTIAAFGEDEYVYILTHDMNNRICIQCLRVSDWTVRSGWNPNGYLNFGLTGHSRDEGFGHMIMPFNDEYLMWVDGSRNGFILFLGKATGTAGYSTRGNWVDYDLGGFDYESQCCFTDGRFCYAMVQHYISSNGYLQSADTDGFFTPNYNVGAPGAGHPPTIGSGSADYHKMSGVACNGRIVITAPSSGIYIGSPDMDYNWIANAAFTDADINDSSISDIVTDGKFAYLIMAKRPPTSSNFQRVVFKFDPRVFEPDIGPAMRTVADLENYGTMYVLGINEHDDGSVGNDDNSPASFFDGYDIWTPGDSEGNWTGTWYAYRMALAAFS